MCNQSEARVAILDFDYHRKVATLLKSGATKQRLESTRQVESTTETTQNKHVIVDSTCLCLIGPL